jgi:hypothetical protein
MSLGSFLSGVVAKIHGAAVKVAALFTEIFGSQAAEAFGTAALNLLKSDLGQLVVSEVEALAGVTNLTGAEKAVKAQSAVLAQAKTLGISASTSIVNLLIETAVQFVTGNLTAVKAIVIPVAPAPSVVPTVPAPAV